MPARRTTVAFATISLLRPAAGAYAQDLSSQIDAVYAAQQRNQEAAEAAAESARAAALQADIEARRQRASELAETRRRTRVVEQDARASRKRDQDYEDQVRSLDLQERALKIEAERKVVSRSNEYINRDLAQQDAQTDLVRSQADQARNISAGAKTLLEDTGTAEIKAAEAPTSRAPRNDAQGTSRLAADQGHRGS